MHPIIASFGPITIYTYGLMVGIAVVIGIYFAKLQAVKKNINPDLIYDLSLYLIIGSLIGARVYYLLFFDPFSFIKDPISIIKIWQGGLAIHGAILGGVLAGILFAKKRKISFWVLGDLIAPSLILGQAIGRIGCFLNGCCFGVPTESKFGIRFPSGSLADFAYNGLAVHPTQLYEVTLNIIAFGFLFALRRKIKFEGGLFLLYLMMYGCIRLVVSSLRGDSMLIWDTNIKIAQIISGIIFIVGLVVFIKRQKNA